MKNSEIIEMTTAELIERVETEKAALNKMTMNHTHYADGKPDADSCCP